MSTWEQVVKLLKETNSKNVVIVCHRNADPDALSSAHSLRNLMSGSCPYVTQIVVVADTVNQVSKKIVEAYPEMTISGEIPFKPDAFVLVDVNNPEHTGKFAGIIEASNRPIIVVDHHVSQTRPSTRSAVSLVDEDASSTAEIVSLLNESVGRKPSKTEATILLTGIIYDSKRFSRIGKHAFRVTDSLLGFGGDYEGALSVLRHAIERSEKIARLKAAQRSRLTEVGGWIATCSNVSSFAASACRSLIDLGSDIAIVSSKKKKDIRITTRSSNAFYEKTKVNLARILENIGIELGGHGGGHATAATVSGIIDASRAERLILTYIDELIHGTKGESKE